MNFFKNMVNKLFDKEEETILNECIAFDEAGLVFTIFVRSDTSKERIKYAFQEHTKQKQWFYKHTGPASIMAYQTEPEKRTMHGKIGFTSNKERIFQVSWSSPSAASVYFFRDFMMELSDIFAVQNLLKLQTKPIPEIVGGIVLKDFTEEDIKVEELDPEKILKNLQTTEIESSGLTSEQKAIAKYVVFEEDDETEQNYRVSCQLNKDCKVSYATSLLLNIANGLECTSFELIKSKTSCTVHIVIKPGETIDVVMSIGLNSEKIRVLQGTYPHKYLQYGRNFWIRYVEALSKNGCLFGQTLLIPSPSTSSKKQEEENLEDSGLEYDSSDYEHNSEDSENSVDSDPE